MSHHFVVSKPNDISMPIRELAQKTVEAVIVGVIPLIPSEWQHKHMFCERVYDASPTN
jgi:hypothetical protein